jgi:hypothetical protein
LTIVGKFAREQDCVSIEAIATVVLGNNKTVFFFIAQGANRPSRTGGEEFR